MTEPGSVCRNCGAGLEGRYCHQCGQRQLSAFTSLREFLGDAFREFLELDGKFVQTVRRLVFAPGVLTREFLEGRRARYVSPFRLYIVFSALFFLVGNFSGARVRITAPPPESTPSAAEGSPRVQRLLEASRHVQKDNSQVMSALRNHIPTAMFVLVPVFGLMLLVVYRKSTGFYVPHLYFAIHFHAFAFLVFTLASLVRFLPGDLVIGRMKVAGMLAMLLRLTIVPYLVVGLRRVHGGSWGGTTARALGLLLAHLMLLFLSVVMIGIAAVMAMAWWS